MLACWPRVFHWGYWFLLGQFSQVTPYAMFHSLERLPWAATGPQVRFSIAIDRKEVISLSSCQFFIRQFFFPFLFLRIHVEPCLFSMNFNYWVSFAYAKNTERDQWGLLLQKIILSADDMFWRRQSSWASIGDECSLKWQPNCAIFSPCSSPSVPVLIMLSCPIRLQTDECHKVVHAEIFISCVSVLLHCIYYNPCPTIPDKL